MNRWLAIGYLLTIAIVAAGALTARGSMPYVGESTSHLLSLVILAALMPAAIPVLVGANRSIGKLRRGLGFSIFGLNLLVGVNSMLVALLLASGAATSVAA
jgi:hypothetical protein